MVNEQSGEARCPHDPNHNSTAVLVDDNLYTATAAQFSGGDPLIYRPPLRTEQLNLKQLNGKFVFHYNIEKALLFANDEKMRAKWEKETTIYIESTYSQATKQMKAE